MERKKREENTRKISDFYVYYCVISVVTIVYIHNSVLFNNYYSMYCNRKIISTTCTRSFKQKKNLMANSDITLHIQPFRTDSDPASLDENWKYWIEEFEYELYLQRVPNDKDKIMRLK